MLLNLLIISNYIKVIDISGYVQENKILSETQKLPDPQTMLTLPILYNYGKTRVSVYIFGKGIHKQDKIAYPIG